MTVIYSISIIFFLFISLLLCGVILLQESKSMGLGASFGGDSGGSLFGASTGDVLKRFTAWLAVIFLGACVLLSFWTVNIGRSSKESDPSETIIETIN